jgi:hypothetical protein
MNAVCGTPEYARAESLGVVMVPNEIHLRIRADLTIELAGKAISDVAPLR